MHGRLKNDVEWTPNLRQPVTPIEFSEGGLVCRNGGLPGNLS